MMYSIALIRKKDFTSSAYPSIHLKIYGPEITTKFEGVFTIVSTFKDTIVTTGYTLEKAVETLNVIHELANDKYNWDCVYINPKELVY